VIKDEIDQRKKKLQEYEALGSYPNRQKNHKDQIKNLEGAIRNMAEDYAKKALVRS